MKFIIYYIIMLQYLVGNIFPFVYFDFWVVLRYCSGQSYSEYAWLTTKANNLAESQKRCIFEGTCPFLLAPWVLTRTACPRENTGSRSPSDGASISINFLS